MWYCVEDEVPIAGRMPIILGPAAFKYVLLYLAYNIFRAIVINYFLVWKSFLLS